MKIYKLTDRIKVQISDVTFWLSPLSADQKAELMSQTKIVKGEEKTDGWKVTLLTLKYSIKAIEGLVDVDDEPYQLSFDPDGTLSLDCVNELMQIECSTDLMLAATSLMNKIKDPELPGVKVTLPASKKKSVSE